MRKGGLATPRPLARMAAELNQRNLVIAIITITIGVKEGVGACPEATLAGFKLKMGNLFLTIC